MSYSDFDLPTARDRFGLTLIENVDLFAGVPDAVPGDTLKQTLADWAPAALAMNTEKARSEFIIAPVLMEVVRQTDRRVSLFSGLTLDVDKARGLSGVCDYLLARSAERFFLAKPVAAVVEAKREDIVGGLGQCAAALVAARQFNADEATVYGAVTTGNVWRFLRLSGTELTIDVPEYYLQQVGKILGILMTITAPPAADG